jgi:hypothetical protein
MPAWVDALLQKRREFSTTGYRWHDVVCFSNAGVGKS